MTDFKRTIAALLVIIFVAGCSGSGGGDDDDSDSDNDNGSDEKCILGSSTLGECEI